MLNCLAPVPLKVLLFIKLLPFPHYCRTSIVSQMRIHTKLIIPQLSVRNVVAVERNVTHATNVLLAICFVSGTKKGTFLQGLPCTSCVVSKSKCSTAVLTEISLSDAHSKLNIPMFVNGVEANALVGTGSTLSHLSDRLVKRLRLKLERSDHCVN